MSSNIASGYTHEQDDVLKTLGLSVVAGQGVERLMSTCMAFVLRDKPLVSPEQLDGIMRRHSTATLGQLLRILREPVDLHPTFDERFERFLEIRKSSRIACSTCRAAWTFIRTQAGRTSRRSCCASWMMAKPSR